MSFSESMTAENGTFTVKGPAGDQVLHRACVVTRTAADVYRPHVPFVPVPSPVPRPDRAHQERQFFRFNLQRILVRRQSPSCQIQWVSIAVGLPGAAAPTWVNIAREISKWLLEWQPRSAPSRRKVAPRGLHRKASRSADRQVEYLPH